MKIRKARISKLERIPKIGSPFRDIILDKLTEMPDYINAMNRGLRFFTNNELEDIQNTYNEGMTWDEIESVLSRNGILLKHSTFRKYIQDEIIPKAIGHKSTTSGRIAIYGSNIIKHLNFVNFFYNVTDAPMIDSLMEFIGGCEITYEDAIESVLGGSGVFCVELLREIGGMGSCEATQAIEKILAGRDDQAYVLGMVDNLAKKFEKYIAKDFSELEKYLSAKKMLATQLINDVSQDTVEAQS